MLNIRAESNEYVLISDPFIATLPSGRKIIVRAYEKYELNIWGADLIDYYEEILDAFPNQKQLAKVFKHEIKNPRKTQIKWGHGNTDLFPKNGVIRKRPSMYTNFTKESIYGPGN